MGGIYNTAIAAGNFKTLVATTKSAGVVETLNTKGPFTVFAPTDDAFVKIPKGTVERLLKDIPKLKAILTYYVVEGAVPASDVVQHKKLTTLQGQDLTNPSTLKKITNFLKKYDAFSNQPFVQRSLEAYLSVLGIKRPSTKASGGIKKVK